MAMRTSHPLRRLREQKLLDVRTGREGNDGDVLQHFSRCPSCNQECDVILILPCSHTMCVQCVAAGETQHSGEPRHRSVRRPVCSALCPECRDPVELPCWDWSTVTSCLPKHPSIDPACVSREETSEDHLQRNTRCWDITTHRSMYGSNIASTSVSPVDDAVDLQEEEMERSVFGLCFALDPLNVPPSLHLSKSSLTITYQGGGPPGPPPAGEVRRSVTSDPVVLPQVCGDVVIARGQYYWEVDVCNSSNYMIGVRSSDGSGGWWFQRRGLSFSIVYDGSQEPLYTIPPQIKTLGVFLNIGGGVLSFYNPLTQEHLATLPTHFHPAGVLPALGLGQGRLRLRSGLPPPQYVFLSRDSAYRTPRGPCVGQWRQQTPFQSVRKVIQKFERLALSDFDSGFVLSSQSSCSTLTSLPDLAIPGKFPSRQGEQETGVD